MKTYNHFIVFRYDIKIHYKITLIFLAVTIVTFFVFLFYYCEIDLQTMLFRYSIAKYNPNDKF